MSGNMMNDFDEDDGDPRTLQEYLESVYKSKPKNELNFILASNDPAVWDKFEKMKKIKHNIPNSKLW